MPVEKVKKTCSLVAQGASASGAGAWPGSAKGEKGQPLSAWEKAGSCPCDVSCGAHICSARKYGEERPVSVSAGGGGLEATSASKLQGVHSFPSHFSGFGSTA